MSEQTNKPQKFTAPVRRGLVLIEQFIDETPWLQTAFRGKKAKDVAAARRWLHDRVGTSKLRLSPEDRAAMSARMKRLWAEGRMRPAKKEAAA